MKPARRRPALFPAGTYARALAVTIQSNEKIAEILDCLLCCEDDEKLTDNEAAAGQLLFESLCELRPDAVELAMKAADA